MIRNSKKRERECTVASKFRNSKKFRNTNLPNFRAVHFLATTYLSFLGSEWGKWNEHYGCDAGSGQHSRAGR